MELIKSYNEENLFKTEFTGSGWAILILLVLALIGLGERVLYDLARTFASPIGDFGYFNNPQVITVHAFFVVGLLILTLAVNYVFGRKKEKYALALIPYFLASIVLAVQLAIQLGAYFTTHHNNLQFYLVMSLLVVVTSYGIFHIQNNYKKDRDTRQANNTGILAIFVVIFAIFAVLILSFNKNEQIPYNISQNANTNSYGYYPDASTQSIGSGEQSLQVHSKITGKYILSLNYLGTNHDHNMFLIEDDWGNLTGLGGNPTTGTYIYEWEITSGKVSGNTIDFYANLKSPPDALNPQTVMHIVGVTASNGTISGSWYDNYRGENRTGSFTATLVGVLNT